MAQTKRRNPFYLALVFFVSLLMMCGYLSGVAVWVILLPLFRKLKKEKTSC